MPMLIGEQPRPCATCGAAVDALRAPRVRHLRGRFRYFCSEGCSVSFPADALQTPLPVARGNGPGTPSSAPEVRRRDDIQQLRALEAPLSDGPSPALRRGAPDDDAVPAPVLPKTEVVEPTDVTAVLTILAALSGGLAVVLGLAGEGSAVAMARLILVLVGAGAHGTQAFTRRRDTSEESPITTLAGPVVGVLVTVLGVLQGGAVGGDAVTLGGVLVAVFPASAWLIHRARRRLDAEREHIVAGVDATAHRLLGDEVVDAPASDLRPGEELLIETGETVPADVTITAGSGVFEPWLDAPMRVERGEGDHLVAGSKLVTGRVVAVVSWTGNDRSWLRLSADPRRRADLLVPVARFGRTAAATGAPTAAAIAFLVSLASSQGWLVATAVAGATFGAFAQAGVAQLGGIHVARGVLRALASGIVFRTAHAFDVAGQVSNVAYCARGTLLLGEPELTNIEPLGKRTAKEVLELLAGAEAGATHPVAKAVLRAVRARQIRPDGVRSPEVLPGLGVIAVASNGKPLVVGSRALMLRERISVASAEPVIMDLEAMGRTVLLVAQGGRLVGVVGLQDGLRSGARAAVQRLLDVGVEPILLSGDARETCEALGRTLDIDHIRPELLPEERGEEVRRLCDAGAVVAVVGRSPTDDAALSVANVAIALRSAGSSVDEWGVLLASDDVRDAAQAVQLARSARHEARLALWVVGACVISSTALVVAGLAPLYLSPLAALAGTAGALARLATLER